MTVRELRKKFREYNPDAVVMIAEKKDGFQEAYDIGRFAYQAPEPDPWRAKCVVILRKEEAEDEQILSR